MTAAASSTSTEPTGGRAAGGRRRSGQPSSAASATRTISNGGTVGAANVNAAQLPERGLRPGRRQRRARRRALPQSGHAAGPAAASSASTSSGNLLQDVPGARLRVRSARATSSPARTARFRARPCATPARSRRASTATPPTSGRTSTFRTPSGRSSRPNTSTSSRARKASRASSSRRFPALLRRRPRHPLRQRRSSRRRTSRTLQSIGLCVGGPASTETLPDAAASTSISAAARELVTRDTYRFVAGIQGDFNDDWNYEVSFNYGHVDIHQDELNDLDPRLDVDRQSRTASCSRYRRGPQRRRPDRLPRQRRRRSDQRPAGLRADQPVRLRPPSQAALDFVNTTSFVDSEGERV